MSEPAANLPAIRAVDPVERVEPDAVWMPSALPSMADLDVIDRIADRAAKSAYVAGARTIERAATLILAGRELRIGPWQALSGIHIIKERPAISAHLMNALVQRFIREQRGGIFRATEQTDERCTVEFRRPEWPSSSSVTWTIADARRAGLGVDVRDSNWAKFPRQMLFARATGEAARSGFPDVVQGLYTPEELEDVPGPAAVVPPADVAGAAPFAIAAPVPADPVPAQPAAADAGPDLDWTALWAWARPRGFVNGKAAEAKIGPIDVATETPAQVKARMERWLAERAEPTEKSVDRVALDALHAAARDRGFDPPHPALKTLQAIWADRWPDRAADSLATWPATDLRRFREEVYRHPPAELAELVAGAAASSAVAVDPETGEILNGPPAMTEREAVIAVVRERAQACRTAEDWRALAAELPADDGEAWAVMAGEARTPATVNVLLAEAKEAGALTKELRGVLHRAATRARDDLAARGP